jgi:hypothetical protein
MCSVPFSPEKVLLWGLDLQIIQKGVPKPLLNQHRKEVEFQDPLDWALAMPGPAWEAPFGGVFGTSKRAKNWTKYKPWKIGVPTPLGAPNWESLGIDFGSFFSLKAEHSSKLWQISNPHRHPLAKTSFFEPQSTNKAPKIILTKFMISELGFS